MKTDARHTQSIGKKYPHGPDPVEGHQAGTDRAQGRVGSGAAVSTSLQEPSRKAGPCFSFLTHRRIHPRVLLARSLLPEGKDPCAEQSLLAGEVRGKQSPGPEKRPEASTRGLVRPDGLGVFLIDDQVSDRVYRQNRKCLGPEEGSQVVVRVESRVDVLPYLSGELLPWKSAVVGNLGTHQAVVTCPGSLCRQSF